MRNIATAAGVGMAMIASEHFFSTFLSSPWTTEKFAETDEDKAKVRRLYWMAVVVSLIAAGVLAFIIKEPWPVVAAVVLSAMYILVYERALSGKI